ncbi:unnamed protein product [Ectocarpus fasciculatus]
MLEECYRKYSKRECDSTELSRVRMNLEQARSQHNYTKIGFLKLKTPAAAWGPIKNFYDRNKHHAKQENWPRGNTYVNHWTAPSKMVSFEDGSLRGSGAALKQAIWNGVRPVLEEWTGKQLKETSLYGIRIYTNNSVLATHLDRLPLVTSCIINVDQDVDEPWPIEVYDHAGKAHNVTMQPGDMVLYESHTVLHGRPFPLKGNYFANLFVHFIPTDHDHVNQHDVAVQRNIAGHEYGNHEFDDDHARGEHYADGETFGNPGQTELHRAAQKGDIKMVYSIVQSDPEQVHQRDRNGWQPLHEAVHSGHADVAKLLISHGADVNHRTNSGGTPLWWARGSLDPNHPVLFLLNELGAEDGDGGL